MKMLNFTKKFSIFCFLDNNEYGSQPSFEVILALGAVKTHSSNTTSALKGFQEFIDESNDWIFGHISYDLKNELYPTLKTRHPIHRIDFPVLSFFVPEIILLLDKDQLQISVPGGNPDVVFDSILSIPGFNKSRQSIPEIKSRFTENEYISTVSNLQKHILRGDCYEINLCQEFYAEEVIIDPLSVYRKLNTLSPNPFSAFYKNGSRYLICSSPERFLKRSGTRIISQPIKGTAKRFPAAEEDKKSRDDLINSSKERSENVMIVDLVRNDLSKVCTEGSVKVDGLFGIYSFPQVHQMISTISGTLENGKNFTDIIRATFPMGSMTGAPKKRVMEIIDQYEKTSRGLFSGSIGYIKEDGDFDFNVVIRSILYDEDKKYLSMPAGSAITFYSDPKNEYRECLLKIEAMKQVLESSDKHSIPQ